MNGNPTERGQVRLASHTVAVASGKGGVGKSTVALNLAATWAAAGAAVGLFDVDVYGPSLPTLVGIAERATVHEGRIIPFRKFGLTLVSFGFLTLPGRPLMVRGPMLEGALRHLIDLVQWPQLDYMVLDLPPGAGEVHAEMLALVHLEGCVIVTTPQEVAVSDVRRSLRLFSRVGLSVLGFVENMSWIECPNCETRFELFPAGGASRLSADSGVPVVGRIPLSTPIAESGDTGVPAVLDPTMPQVRDLFRDICSNIDDRLSSSFGGSAQPAT